MLSCLSVLYAQTDGLINEKEIMQTGVWLAGKGQTYRRECVRFFILELFQHPVQAKYLLPWHDDVTDQEGRKSGQGKLLNNPATLEIGPHHEVCGTYPAWRHEWDFSVWAFFPEVLDLCRPFVCR